MATHKSVNITSLKNTETEKQRKLGAVHQYIGIYRAIVTDTRDVQKNGRLRVRLLHNSDITNFSSNPNLNSQKELDIIVSWTSPFAGASNVNDTVATGSNDEDRKLAGTQTSYGMWMCPPDIGNHVIVAFESGDLAKGYVLGCLFHSFMNHMVPGIARSKTFTDDDSKTLEVPVAEYNKKGDEAKGMDWKIKRSNNGDTPADNVRRASYTPLVDGLMEQGLEQDKTRGLSSSSARREAPSQVYGVLTPGGHQLVMDDADQKLIRLRTTSGAQILLDETNGNVYIINKKGTGWVEINDTGKIDVWSNDSISVRSQKDINLRADRDLNIESGRNINVKTNQTTGTGQPSDTTNLLPGVNGAFNLDVAGALNIKSTDATTLTSGKEFHLQSTATFLTATEGDTNILTQKGNHIETTASPTGKIQMNGPAAVASTPYDGLSAKVDDDGNLYFTNTLYTRNSEGNRNTEKVATILTRFPSREPFAREEF